MSNLKSSLNTQRYIDQTKTWLKTVVVKYNLCPFAKPVIDTNRLAYFVEQSESTEMQLQNLILQCQKLDQHTEIETMLLIYPKQLKTFDDYLDFLALAEDLLKLEGYEGIYQLASFHPDYCFHDNASDDPANYTNRSPYPMLHVLREASIEKALNTYPDPDKIPQRNITICRQLGQEKMKQLLVACYDIYKSI